MKRHKSSIDNEFQYDLKDPEQAEKDIPLNCTDQDRSLLSFNDLLIKSDITNHYKIKKTILHDFLEKSYLVFDYKINNCILKRCFNDLNIQQRELSQCKKECQQGVQKAQDFVDNLIQEHQQKFQYCIEQAGQPMKNTFIESLKCFDTAINEFDYIQDQVKKEFQYYE